MRRFAKPLYGLTPVPRVRIPPSPPDFLRFYFQPLQRNSELKGSAYGFQGISSEPRYRFCGINMALSLKLYRVVDKGRNRRYGDRLGTAGRRSKEDVRGPFYLRYGLKYESVVS